MPIAITHTMFRVIKTQEPRMVLEVAAQRHTNESMSFIDPTVQAAIEQMKLLQDTASQGEPRTLTLKSRKYKTWDGERPLTNADVSALEECFATCDIRHLHISYRNMANLNGWTFLKKSQHLESISLDSDLQSGDEITEAAMVSFIDAITQWAPSTLRRVVLESFGFHVTQQIVAALRRLVAGKPLLEHLELFFWGCQNVNVGKSLGKIFFQQSCCRLKVLKLPTSQVGDKGVEYILKGLSRQSCGIQELQLMGNKHLSPKRILDLVSFLKNAKDTLKILHLQQSDFFSNIDDQYLDAFLDALSQCSVLHTLSLHGCALSGRTVYKFLRSHLPTSLVSLDMECNDISDRAIMVILRHAVPYLTSVQELILRPRGGYRIEAALPFYWDALHRNTSLYTLHLMYLRDSEMKLQEAFRKRNMRLTQTRKLLSSRPVPLAVLAVASCRLANDDDAMGLSGLNLLVPEFVETLQTT